MPDVQTCRNTLLIALLSLLCGLPAYGQSDNLEFHWLDAFSDTEQHRLQTWISKTDAALTQLVGELPFKRHIYFHRRDGSREPVPWAHTERGNSQGVHFYVDLSFPQTAFEEDWTAPHELSHLVIPYLGRSNAWFAEGFASYMQYQVMMQMGVLSSAEAQRRYEKRINRAQSSFALDDLPFAEAAPKLREQGQYPTMYWGGAVYFKQVAQQLTDQNKPPLMAILKSYVECCRVESLGLHELIRRLDQLAAGQIFQQCLDEFEELPGFPQIP